MTNYDRIQQMDIEQRVDFLMNYKDCVNCLIGKDTKDCNTICGDKTEFVKWLMSEVKE